MKQTANGVDENSQIVAVLRVKSVLMQTIHSVKQRGCLNILYYYYYYY